MNSNICIICVRKNSKGIKNKNLLKLNNKSLIEISFKQAKHSKIFKKIILSSDSDHMIKIANKLGFDLVIKRPNILARDKSGKVDVIKHALLKAEKYFNENYQNIFDLDVTSPLRNINDIKQSLKIFTNKKANNLITVCEAKKNPYFNMVQKNKNKIQVVANKKQYKSRQVAPKVYEMNASIYIWKRNSLFKNSMFNTKTVFYKMPISRSIDIDSEFDFKIVKFIYENKKIFRNF